ncbi:MAG: D-tyrosyl-tRNA(Tyr) deacylase [Xanthomonadales bacterium]|nr:D-tyrosyl-tRNA(Tyr) deacylase [Xanthomonadales bacterium]NIN60129.1 D-tyrosyl-tRNA(Tyr) deacylase [Xanthomonadales bacterium]NIN74276.1 D-tyrosyl-tRNA(Tyr) deacylase [Xanthomonadales bacterium]NIO12785.1 D-tyrosyl-tRNA(Tyr) deacylase [Xanthomonadales bacterium]NIP12522.1 D-tyrosyl-tRNA(Tyr) deacylase [Xanthomonadales bacterium]
MIALLQRVTEASVHVNGREVGAIGTGILALVGVEKRDTEAQAERLLERILAYRMFDDGQGRMNLDLRDVDGELLLVSQFTLAADTDKGHRASFSSAAAPEHGQRLFDLLVQGARAALGRCETGVFGAHMQVKLVNDGPVTFRLRVPPPVQS